MLKASEASDKNLAVSYFRMGNPTLSSALSVFTTEFGMVSGGSHSLWPPGKPANNLEVVIKAPECCIPAPKLINRLGVIWSSLTVN